MACVECATAGGWSPIDFDRCCAREPSRLCYATLAGTQHLASLAKALEAGLPAAEGPAPAPADAQAPEGYYAGEGAHLRRALEAMWRSSGGAPLPCPGGEGCRPCSQARSLLSSVLAAGLPVRLLERFAALGFEARKDAAWLFDAALCCSAQLGAEAQVAECMRSCPAALRLMVAGCGEPWSAPHFGHILRACARRPGLAGLLLEQRAELRLLEFAQSDNLDVASEAFESLQVLLLHTGAAAAYLEARCDALGEHLHGLLATSYFARRQALWLLGSVMLSGDHRAFRGRYIGSRRSLEIHMNLLRDASLKVQVGAFHIFKVFVANPYKPRSVEQILLRNRDGLLRHLARLQMQVDGDALMEDLRAVVHMLEKI